MFSAMKVTITILLLGVSVQGTTEEGKVTPVQKVLDLMQGMVEKGKKEKHDEQVQFAAYKQFCDDTSVEKTQAIKDATDLIGVLKADIQKYVADAERLTLEMKEHEEAINAATADLKAATEVRENERAEYEATEQDYTESIDAIGRAIQVLKKQNYDRKQASFAQIAFLKNMNLIPADAKRAIDLFISQDQQSDEGLSSEAPEANAYEFQSQGIVDMLTKLMDKFVDEQTALRKEEANAKHAFGMVKQDLTAKIDQDTAATSEKTEEKAKKLEAKAESEATLADTTATKSDDEKYLSDLTATCTQKTSDFEQRQQLRGEEIAAIEKAIEIISSGSVAGAADKHLPGLVQTKTALMQLRADGRSPVQERVAVYLRAQARHLDSRILSALAVRVDADPFKKVKKMIKDLIVRLMEEANEEAEHKGWCDTELSTNEQTRKEKTESVETLHAEIDQLEASIAKLTEDISDLTQAVAELDAAMAKATKLRQEEKAKKH